MIVADTDVLIDYLHGSMPMASRVELELQSRTFATTAVSAFELWAGARSARQASAVELSLAAMTILPLDAESARRAAEVRRQLRAHGEDIGTSACGRAGCSSPETAAASRACPGSSSRSARTTAEV